MRLSRLKQYALTQLYVLGAAATPDRTDIFSQQCSGSECVETIYPKYGEALKPRPRF
jgi:hypothetical protein